GYLPLGAEEAGAPSMRTRTFLFAAGSVAALVVFAAAARRFADERRASRTWSELAALADPDPPRFDPAMAANLPPPARRWFLRSLVPGTPLWRVAEIEMEGELGLGDRAALRYQPLRAREILAPPHGFVWRPEVGRWPMRIAGSDGQAGDGAWTRFWLLGLVPIVRAADTPDLVRSAAARGVAEAALWLPTTLLPRHGVRWEPVDAQRTRAIVEHAGLRHELDLEVADDGRLRTLRLMRWSNANREGVFRLQPFGGTVLEHGTVEGVTVATRVEAGNFFGEEGYVPFFRVELSRLRFLG
ncbi:MAG: hypothetical protein NZ555_14060, partial [Geminicoccaceae bacterium]|nr:hypothetical protein [Geminicoccaceae bacterium]